MANTINKGYAFEATAIRSTTKTGTRRIVQKLLLFCGVISSLLYISMNIFVPMLYPGYDASSQTVSELSAINAPTRSLWVTLAIVYSVLLTAFGFGIRTAAAENNSLRTAGTLMIVYALIGLAWPPMHQREVLGAGGGTLTDSLHIVFTIVAVILMLLIAGYCSRALGTDFRIYSIFTIVFMLLFGTMTAVQSPMLEANLPTPMIGVWERVSIGSYMLWVIVLAIMLLRRKKAPLGLLF
jgi:hypothetical protein